MRLIIVILIGFAAGYVAGKITGEERGFWKNVLFGVVGSGLGSWLFGLLNIHASGSIGRFIFSVAGACIFSWLLNKLFRR